MTEVPPGKHTTYTYAKLGSIRGSASKLNVFAVVVRSSPPAALPQGIFLRDMTLADETRSDFGVTLKYDSATAPPPEFFAPGTVLRFHRMVVSAGRIPGTFTGSGKTAGTPFSWVSYTLDSAGRLEKHTAAKQFTSSPADDERARELIRWWQAQGHPYNSKKALKKVANAPAQLTKFCDVTLESGEISCVGFVLDVKLYEQKKRHFELFLWDGSGSMRFE